MDRCSAEGALFVSSPDPVMETSVVENVMLVTLELEYFVFVLELHKADCAVLPFFEEEVAEGDLLEFTSLTVMTTALEKSSCYFLFKQVIYETGLSPIRTMVMSVLLR